MCLRNISINTLHKGDYDDNGDDDDDNNNSCNTVFPRDIVCLRNISINALHKGDDDDNDDDDYDNNNNNNTSFICMTVNANEIQFRFQIFVINFL